MCLRSREHENLSQLADDTRRHVRARHLVAVKIHRVPAGISCFEDRSPSGARRIRQSISASQTASRLSTTTVLRRTTIIIPFDHHDVPQGSYLHHPARSLLRFPSISGLRPSSLLKWYRHHQQRHFFFRTHQPIASRVPRPLLVHEQLFL